MLYRVDGEVSVAEALSGLEWLRSDALRVDEAKHIYSNNCWYFVGAVGGLNLRLIYPEKYKQRRPALSFGEEPDVLFCIHCVRTDRKSAGALCSCLNFLYNYATIFIMYSENFA